MRRNFAHLFTAAACCALLASCGGGDGNSPTPTPSPSPSPSPSPTPTPTPTAVDFDFAKAFTASAVNTSYSYAFFTPSGGAEIWSDGTRRDGLSKITYTVSPESADFDWPDSAALTTFVAADLQSASPTRRTYRKGTDGLVMELPFNHVMRVAYENVQPYILNTVNGTLRAFRVSLFYNTVTTTADITSNLTYTGTAQVAGGKAGTTAPGLFSSPATTLTVASSDKKITGSIQIFENVGGTQTLRATLPISGTVVAGGAFIGNIDDTTNGFKGQFVGSLAGPSREEVVLIFNVAHSDGREFIGSYIGG
ncbi:hypothetical protein N0B51_05830 [Tsuneonella sp. YG55]|uniref:Transferrin binding protein-like solute binding protein n=1 Tax=Tsuneonella litorea TaxID=2976475 RepID=A0A9X3A942_9SPHN|nr:hypothetical protein [Tsuneonella litorea]MCT2558495.1 hypothetical protein [Tsuneonella litorea]